MRRIPLFLLGTFLCFTAAAAPISKEEWAARAETVFQKILDLKNARDGVEYIGGPFPREDYRNDPQIFSDGCLVNYAYAGKAERSDPKTLQVIGSKVSRKTVAKHESYEIQVGTSQIPKGLGTNEVAPIVRGRV